MLKEFPATRLPGEPGRRWFQDEYFDLLVWIDDDGRPWGFQLSYNRGPGEHALTWTPERGYRHERVDSGETDPLRNLAPVLLADGPFPAEALRRRFFAAGADLEADIRTFVVDRLSTLREGFLDA